MRISDWSSDVCSSDLRASSRHSSMNKNAPGFRGHFFVRHSCRKHASHGQRSVAKCSIPQLSTRCGGADFPQSRRVVYDHLLPRTVAFEIALDPAEDAACELVLVGIAGDRKSTRLNSSH